MRCSPARALSALGLAVLLIVPQAALATTVRVHTLASLAARADRIVVGDVIEVRHVLEGGRLESAPVTVVTLRTLRTVKGRSSSLLVLEFLGGDAEGERVEVSDMPGFEPGERVLLFLRDDARLVSPVVGLMQGCFRVFRGDGMPGERVADCDGRPLYEEDVATTEGPRSGGAPLSLAQFEKAIARVLTAPTGRRDAASDDDALGRPESVRGPAPAGTTGVPAPGLVTVALGPSPVLLDGCDGWRCVIDHAVGAAVAAVGVVEGQPGGGGDGQAGKAAHTVTVSWGRSLLGRAMGEDVLALSIRRVAGSTVRTALVFNDGFAWNAYAGPARRSPDGRVLLDLGRVALREVAPLFASAAPAAGAGTGGAPYSVGRRARPVTASASRADLVRGTVEPLAACGGGGAVVDPRLLLFTSRDHSRMTGYQVGFFRPGAAGPTDVIDLPLSALLVKIVIDLPAWSAPGPPSLVADIRRASLSTPIGDVYTYRVRGVWAEGVTAWSEPTPRFVRCGAR